MKKSKVNKDVKYPSECKWCGSKLVVKEGKYGYFLGCINFPDCKYTFDIQELVICPNCNGRLRIKHGKYGDFIGCENFPKCKYSISLIERKKTDIICSECRGFMIIHKGKEGFFLGCENYPKCRKTLKLRDSYEKPTKKELEFINNYRKQYSNQINIPNQSLITNEKILDILKNEWKTSLEIIKELNIIDNLDKKYLISKLKFLVRKGSLMQKTLDENDYFKCC